MKTSLLMTLLCGILTACGVIEAKEPYKRPDLPEHILTCAEEPEPGDEISTQIQLLEWVEEVRSAGEECRINLKTTRRILVEDDNQ